jgi:hypothetical protein
MAWTLTAFLVLIPFNDLDTYPGQWISDDIIVVVQPLLELGEYGRLFDSSADRQAWCYPTFITVEDQELWRLVVVYADEVVLFQEDHEPIVTQHDIQVTDCLFSPSGDYVVVLDDNQREADAEGIRIDTETSEVRAFDSESNGQSHVYVRVWDDGEILLGRGVNPETGEGRLYFIDSDLDVRETYNLFNVRNIALSNNYVTLTCSSGLVCFDKAGSIVWESTDGYQSIVSPTIIESLDVLLVPTSGGIEIRSLSSGELLHLYPYREPTWPSGPVVVSQDLDAWFCPQERFDANLDTRIFEMYTGSLDEFTAAVQPIPGDISSYRLIQMTDNYMLFWRLPLHPNQEHERYIVTDRQLNPVLATTPGHHDSYATLSRDGLRLLFCCMDVAYIAEIGE